jgi:hypothetical protein
MRGGQIVATREPYACCCDLIHGYSCTATLQPRPCNTTSTCSFRRTAFYARHLPTSQPFSSSFPSGHQDFQERNPFQSYLLRLRRLFLLYAHSRELSSRRGLFASKERISQTSSIDVGSALDGSTEATKREAVRQRKIKRVDSFQAHTWPLL